jgi:hypothetical protein
MFERAARAVVLLLLLLEGIFFLSFLSYRRDPSTIHRSPAQRAFFPSLQQG